MVFHPNFPILPLGRSIVQTILHPNPNTQALFYTTFEKSNFQKSNSYVRKKLKTEKFPGSLFFLIILPSLYSEILGTKAKNNPILNYFQVQLHKNLFLVQIFVF